MQKLIRIFGADFDAKQSKAFSFLPAPIHQKAIGLLFSNDSTISLSFDNCMNLTTNQLEFSYRNEALTNPPAKRVVEIDEDLSNCTVISGVVENLKTTHQKNEKRTINIYLLVEQK